MTRRRRDERGTGLVEAAIVIPVFFLFVFGMIDIGMLVFQSNQASAAARDGARVAILDYAGADVADSDDAETVEKAVIAHVEKRERDVAVRCLNGADGSQIPCRTAQVDRDRVEVRVEWPREYSSFVGPLLLGRGGSVSGTSKMVILGKPLPPAGTGGSA